MDQVFSKENKIFKIYWKIGKKYWKSQGKVREFCQSGKVGTLSNEFNFILLFGVHTQGTECTGIHLNQSNRKPTGRCGRVVSASDC